MADEKLDTQIRREQIAEAAMSLVASQGLRRLSLAAVARRVGLVPSGIYRHFKNKDELLLAVLDRVEERLMANVEAARDEADDPIEQLRGVLMRHIRFIREGRAVPRIIFADDVHAGSPERRRRVAQIFNRYAAAVGKIIAAAQSQGQIRPDCNRQTLVMMLFGIVVPAGILWHLTNGGFDVTRHAQRAWQLFLAAAATKPEDVV
ncbi:MAG: TetR/AcrR family transcriptional regulator [Planctomycetaceae bacterium]|nr:TetR/AcrR family transcriptional regulator [Planctomycetaceae bacterium]